MLDGGIADLVRLCGSGPPTVVTDVVAFAVASLPSPPKIGSVIFAVTRRPASSISWSVVSRRGAERVTIEAKGDEVDWAWMRPRAARGRSTRREWCGWVRRRRGGRR